ncbi:MAG: LptF/LptG family permease [Planctomycetales bacterium]|nr:LptF/LptG family permease [Planctomycetales bacterium]
MKILTRYVLSDLLQVFLLTLVGMTTLVFVGLVGKEAVDRGMGVGPIARLAPYILPQAMQFAVPGALLLAVTNIYGRLSAFNEVVAIKSMGVSPWAIAWPTLVLSALVSLGAVALNDLPVSWGRMGVERVFIESLEEVIYGQLRVNRAFTDRKLSITVRRVEGRKLIQPNATLQGSGDSKPWSVTADWAELESRRDRQELVIRFFNAQVDGPTNIAYPDTFEHVIDLGTLFGSSDSGHRSPSTYSLAEIGPAIHRTQNDIEQINNDRSARAAYAMLTGEFEQVSQAVWEVQNHELEGANYILNRLHVEPYRRWSGGFACLAFAMVGVPVAMILRKSDFLASFFVCFAPILIVYYPLLIVSVKQAKDGGIPPWSVWAGNLVLAVAGVGLMHAVINDRDKMLSAMGAAIGSLMPWRRK